MKPPARLLPYIVPKGFICVDGTSLTVCDVNQAAGTFNFMLIEFTQQKVIIPKKAVGEFVNLEVDVISKYVEQSLAAVLARVEALEKRLEEAGCAIVAVHGRTPALDPPEFVARARALVLLLERDAHVAGVVRASRTSCYAQYI